MTLFAHGAELIDEINRTNTATPTLWWLGHAGFAIRYANLTFYVDPCLSSPRARQTPAPLSAEHVNNADLILCTHEHAGHMDAESLPAMLGASGRAKVVLPKSAATFAHDHAHIPFDRMSTTDNGLRIEFFKDNLYGRVYAVPAAHPELEWTPIGGYPRLGYLIRFERITIYHAGDTRFYEDLAARLKPYKPTVAILPVDGSGNLSVREGARLAEEAGVEWVIPMHYGTFDGQPSAPTAFIDHMLGYHPSLKFKVFHIGEKWTVPGLET